LTSSSLKGFIIASIFFTWLSPLDGIDKGHRLAA
jgi:hypothetical protein